jgi:two-component system sensor histidine kinase UhpB
MGQRRGFYDTEFGLAMFALSNLVTFAGLTWWNAGLLYRLDTERTRAEKDLRESEERFRATFEQAAVGIAHVAPDGRWLRVNQKLCDIVGYTREELLARTFQAITHPDDLDADLVAVRQVLSGEIQTYAIDKRYIHKDGQHIWIRLTMSLVREPSGEPKYCISMVEDITVRKRAEDALRKVHNELKVRIEERTAELQRVRLAPSIYCR